MKRLFLAIPIPANIKSVFKTFFFDKNKDINWTSLDNLHVTVVFIGSLAEEKLKNIIEAVSKEIIKEPFTFILKLKAIEVKKYKNKMIWAIFFPNENFDLLSKKLHECLNIELTRPPLPHITLARVKSKNMNVENFEFHFLEGLEIPVNSIALWESKNLGDGIKYHPLAKFELQ